MKKLIMQLDDGALGEMGVTAKNLRCITDHIAMPLAWLANHISHTGFSQEILR